MFEPHHVVVPHHRPPCHLCCSCPIRFLCHYFLANHLRRWRQWFPMRIPHSGGYRTIEGTCPLLLSAHSTVMLLLLLLLVRGVVLSRKSIDVEMMAAIHPPRLWYHQLRKSVAGRQDQSHGSKSNHWCSQPHGGGGGYNPRVTPSCEGSLEAFV